VTAASTPTSDRSPFLIRWGDLLAAAILTLHGVIAWLTRSVGIGIGNDAAHYVLLARSIAELSYRDFHVAGAPLHSQYPPGFPALLSVLSLPFGENIDLLLAVMIGLSMAALAVVYLCVRRRGGRGLALCVLALCAVNPSLVRQAGQILSEMPYMLLTALTVWVVLREPEPAQGAPQSGRATFAAGSAAIASALVRVIGVTMVSALLMHWLLERRYRPVSIIACLSALTVGAWLVMSAMAPLQFVGRSYFADATYARSDGAPFLVTLAERVVRNIPDYATVSLPWAVTRGPITGTIADYVIGLPLMLVVAAAGVWVMWRQSRFVVLYLLCYGTLLVLWPWGGPRFLNPVLPFLLWTGMAGALRLSAARAWLRPLPLLLALLVGGVGVVRAATDIRAMSTCDRSAPLVSATCFTDAQRAFLATAELVRDETPDSAVVLTHIEAILAFVSSRTVLLEEVVDPDPGRILRSLRSQNVDYVVLTPLRPSVQQHVPALRQVCEDLELINEFAPVTFLFRVPPPNVRPERNACDAIGRFEQESASQLPG
jgi:4-amino-4-deoxy-L-arabinose transferase-like glycosyltransferase